MSEGLSAREHDVMNEGRLLRAESDLLMPLLLEKREGAIARLIYHFKEGKTELLTAVAAELSAIEDMRSTINTKIKKAEAIERKVYGHGNQG